MACLLPSGPVGGDIWFELFKRALAHGDQDPVPELGDAGECIGAIGGDPDFRPWLLVGLWRHLDVVKAVVFSVIGEGRLRPRALQDLQRLGKAFAALAVGDAISLVSARKAAASNTENQPALADLVDRRCLFGEPQRVAERQYLNAGPDLHVLGAGGDGAGEGQRCRAYRPFRVDMDFRQPHRVESPALGGVDLFEGGGKGLLVGHPSCPLKLVKHAEFERHLLFSFCLAQPTERPLSGGPGTSYIRIERGENTSPQMSLGVAGVGVVPHSTPVYGLPVLT